MSLIRLGFWAASGAGGISYWIATLGGSSNDEAHSVAIDSSGNSYSLGWTASTGAGSNDILILKQNPAGEVQWQRVLGGSSGEEGYAIAIDSSDNVYVCGLTLSPKVSFRDLFLAKYNTSGAVQWQRILGSSSGDDRGFGVAIDSNDNIYLAGRTQSEGQGNDDFLLAKYNSSGTIQWQRILGGSSGEEGYAIAIDSSDNVYMLGFTGSAGAGSNDFLLVKYNSSGTIQWQRVLGGTGQDLGHSVAIDSSDNVYAFGPSSSAGAGSNDFLLVKYNSSGTVQWQRLLGGTGTDYGNAVAVDSVGNIYVAGFSYSAGAGDFDFLIAKYNSSGTVQWQRLLGGSGRDFPFSIKLDALDNLYIVGYTDSTGSGVRDFIIAKLPSDGSLTGTYELDGVDIVYAASSLTSANGFLTAATSSLTGATSSLTPETSTLTAATSSLTSHFVEI
jgi:uncharacterized delta-60 repeat protein